MDVITVGRPWMLCGTHDVWVVVNCHGWPMDALEQAGNYPVALCACFLIAGIFSLIVTDQ